MSTPIASAITITASDVASRDRQLELATALMRQRAVAGGTHGILVTREDYGTFTVAICPEVPFGLTAELDLV